MAERSSTKTSMRKVAVASLVGNALEWYDFCRYGTAAALVSTSCSSPASTR
jgi:MFS transporter, MHS family, shikimate and dehydroshikimate transport protein